MAKKVYSLSRSVANVQEGLQPFQRSRSWSRRSTVIPGQHLMSKKVYSLSSQVDNGQEGLQSFQPSS
nr:hypothetical protein BgiMline_032183 [Biomphalaria glabrata]